MYCIKCGVELSDGERQCPLCATRVYHPDIAIHEDFPPYPSTRRSPERFNPRGLLFILTFLFAQPIVLTLFIDLRINGIINWSGYVSGAVMLIYIIAILPAWFKKPNPVIFVPIDFAAVGLYLLFIDLNVAGNWFLSFAFPVVGILGLITTAAVTLFRYLPRAGLYIIAGLSVAIGGFCILLEFFIEITFHVGAMFNWSLYPAASGVLFAAMFIVIALCRPIRESLEKWFFV